MHAEAREEINKQRQNNETFSNEYEQFIVRVVIYVLLWTYFLVLGPYVLNQGATSLLAMVALGWASIGSICSFIHFVCVRKNSMPRLFFGMFLDIFSISVIIIAGGALTAPLVLFYLWITLGNGFRFGSRALQFCALSSFLCFLTVFAFAEYWRDRIPESISVIVSLIVLPIYADILIRKLVTAKAEAEAANEAKGRFLATMSHELRTPLNGVIGLSSLLARTKLSQEQREMTTSINASGATLLELVNDVLDLARIEAGKQAYAPETVDLYDLFSSIENIIAPQAQMKSIYFNVFIDASVPRFIVSERRHLQKILINLCGNAVKFTADGGVTLKVRVETEDDNKRIAFAVKDTGVGIVEEEQDAVFDRFTQAKHTGLNVKGGTGLGLAITRELVVLLGGEVGVRSAPGEGSVFHFWTPLDADGAAQIATPSEGPAALSLFTLGPQTALSGVHHYLERADAAYRLLSSWAELSDVIFGECDSRPVVFIAAEAADAAAVGALRTDIRQLGRLLPPLFVRVGVEDESPEALEDVFASVLENTEDSVAIERILMMCGAFGGREAASRSLKKKRALNILIAEDNEVNRQVTSRMLREFGHAVTLAADGDQTLAVLERADFDIVFMDVNMPVITGIEATKIHRMTEDADNRMPIVALTADVTDEGREECLEAGMNDIIYKPVTLESLADAIERNVGALEDADETVSQEEMHVVREGYSDNVVLHPAMAAAGAPVIDVDRLEELRELDSDGSFLKTLVESFFRDAAEILRDAKDAVEAGDAARLQDARHALRSTALNIGAENLSALCETARAIGPEDVAAAGAQFVDDITSELSDVRTRLTAELQ
ncbi:MAG: ATP-binding protein [Pseudomonadota bacterium]